jgi:hypothetical protein
MMKGATKEAFMPQRLAKSLVESTTRIQLDLVKVPEASYTVTAFRAEIPVSHLHIP